MTAPIRMGVRGVDEVCRAAPVDSPLRRQVIRRGASYRWVYRDCTTGHDVEDWLASEREVDAVLAYRERLIRAAAFTHWQRHGCDAGGELADWLAAEREVDHSLARAGILTGFFDRPASAADERP